MVNGIMNFEFQDNCVEFLMDKTLDPESKQIITIKAPTGAGKTVILIKYIDEYLKYKRKYRFCMDLSGKR